MVKDMTSGGCKVLVLPLAGSGWGTDGTESQLTFVVSRAPHRSHSRHRCPGWPVPHLQRAQFSAVEKKKKTTLDPRTTYCATYWSDFLKADILFQA